MGAVAPRKSLLIAYLFWFLLGVFGAHRFYLGKWFTGFLYLISFGFYGLGWMLDGLLLPFLVARVNAPPAPAPPLPAFPPLPVPGHRPPVSLAQEEVILLPLSPAEEDEVAGTPEWVRQRAGTDAVELSLRIAFFTFAPCIFAVTAMMLELWDLLAILVVTLLVGGFIGNAGSLLSNHPLLAKVPMLGDALKYLNQFASFYRRQAPFHFSYYLLYPFLVLPMCYLSPRARVEAKLYGRIVGGLMAIVVSRIGLSYFDVYPPYLGPRDAFIILFLLCFFVSFLMVLFVVPAATTALALNAAHRPIQLRCLVVLGLVSALPVAVAYYFMQRSQVPYVAYQILAQRFEKEKFRRDLRPGAEMFFAYWGHNTKALQDQPGAAVAEHAELTEKFRRHVAGLVVGKEVVAFRVVAWQAKNAGPWLGVGLWESETTRPPRLLFLYGPDGTLYSSWKDLPGSIARQFAAPGATGGFVLRDQELIDDWSGGRTR